MMSFPGSLDSLAVSIMDETEEDARSNCEVDDSPLRSAKNPRSPHGTEDDHTHGSCSMQNQLASSFPMSTPTGSLGGMFVNTSQKEQ